MSDWTTRLRPGITLTAPDGTVFDARWLADEITGKKNVAQFDLPDSVGTEVQDLGAAGNLYPLSLYFEGADHDTTALRLCAAIQQQRGTWTVTHPVYGQRTLQPLSFSLRADPTASAGITRVETQWIEPAAATAAVSAAALSRRTLGLALELDAGSLSQFEALAQTTDPAAAAGLASTGTQALATIQRSPLRTIADGLSGARSAYDQVYTRVVGELTAPALDLRAIGQGIQQLMAIPATVPAGISSVLSAYVTAVDTVLASLSPAAGEEARTAAVMTELVATAAITNMGRAAATSTPSTREEAVAGIVTMQDALAAVTTGLDAAQVAQAGEYFSHSQTYATLAQLVATVQALLLRLLFDLKIAKRFALDRPRSPIEITITEYGGLGDADANLDLFLVTNGLLGLDVLLLPAGREVVVYV